jgi:hypothetical protein
MEHVLSAARTGVEDRTEVGDPAFSGHGGNRLENAFGCARVAGKLDDIAEVCTRHDQKVSGSLRLEVPKDDGLGRCEHDVGGLVAGDDPAEQAAFRVSHDASSTGPAGMVRAARSAYIVACGNTTM